ncbi:hypothetical protein GWI33_001781 [Rhynchophorus ferrugineus]|uniref:Uncharacterized protein n=1 Tax=Rhynchophorus ferrugineus TaxID=354439 RepID=A0A834IL05_RHYFE|nr:hypothetical protein GWI33_001781 [Rhynchophorus ferrugineus]
MPSDDGAHSTSPKGNELIQAAVFPPQGLVLPMGELSPLAGTTERGPLCRLIFRFIFHSDFGFCATLRLPWQKITVFFLPFFSSCRLASL